MKKRVESIVEFLPITPPNFILTRANTPYPIADFSEKELRELGAEFTENLVKFAEQRRNKP